MNYEPFMKGNGFVQTQLTLFDDFVKEELDLRISRSGTFIDNMSLPIHRWFRYSAGFAAPWVKDVLENWKIEPNNTVLDPFSGSGTVSIVCDTLGIKSIGVEAHPFVARISQIKLHWMSDPIKFSHMASEVLKLAQNRKTDFSLYPQLIQRSFDQDVLQYLNNLKCSWLEIQDSSPEADLIWLAITSILRPTSKAGTAQWQYILPNKTKKKVVDPHLAYKQQIEMMMLDLYWMQANAKGSNANVILGDARNLSNLPSKSVDAVITSPPYANNYDYADALRFEMTFWGDVNGWGDLHDAVRKHLIVSSSQHSSKDKLKMEELIGDPVLQPIKNDLLIVMEELARVREFHGGKKHYHTMVGAYFRDISKTLKQLRIVCKEGAPMCWVIGDSAPYGVYCPVDKWIGELALAVGFKEFHFEKLRDRNTKWKNRKHTVPLKEGLLWIEG